jgi:urease alpha subunit
MSRRLNQEAAKSMKYGNISEEEAWKFVTLNPAKLLHIDQYVGSVEAGKHADLYCGVIIPFQFMQGQKRPLLRGQFILILKKTNNFAKRSRGKRTLYYSNAGGKKWRCNYNACG